MTRTSLFNKSMQDWRSVSFSEPSRPKASSNCRILLVEDNDAASKGLAKILRVLGYDVTVVLDGSTALKVLRTTPPPDFLLTDLRLPDIDGREIARFASQLDAPPRVALITGWDLEDETEPLDNWGIDWVFPKPLNVHELVSTLREADAESSKEAKPASESKKPGSGRS